MAGHVVAGVELARLVSLAGGVELWDGRTADDELRDVCLVELASGPAAMARALAAARPFVGIDHPALQPVLAVAPHGQRLALVRAPVPGSGLDDVVAAAGALDAGEGATVAGALGDGLAALHRRGLSHGRVGAATVRVGPDGAVVLTDLGVAAVAEDVRTPPDDVLELARTVTAALAANGPPPEELALLLAALDPALSGHPAARPGAGPLATSCRAAATPVPLRVPPPRRAAPAAERARRTSAPASAVRRSRTTLRYLAMAATALVAVVVAVAVVVPQVGRWRRPAQAAAGEVVRAGLSAQPSASSPSWPAVLSALAQRRGRAYAAADPALLSDVDAAGSSAEAIDRANIAAWRESGSRIAGGVPEVRVVTARRTAGTVAEVTTVETVSPYSVTDPAGRRTAHPAGVAQRWQVQLVLTAAGWRTVRVSPDPGPPGSASTEHP